MKKTKTEFRVLSVVVGKHAPIRDESHTNEIGEPEELPETMINDSIYPVKVLRVNTNDIYPVTPKKIPNNSIESSFQWRQSRGSCKNYRKPRRNSCAAVVFAKDENSRRAAIPDTITTAKILMALLYQSIKPLSRVYAES